jgi:8-oxoguanine deaminase
MRLGSGTAPVRRMVAKRVPVGLGVDGSASNDGGSLLGEARQAMLLQRVGLGPGAMTGRQALELATLGGARVLGRDDIGALPRGWPPTSPPSTCAGSTWPGPGHDPVAALVFCAPEQSSWVAINGRVVVDQGRLARSTCPPSSSATTGWPASLSQADPVGLQGPSPVNCRLRTPSRGASFPGRTCALATLDIASDLFLSPLAGYTNLPMR